MTQASKEMKAIVEHSTNSFVIMTMINRRSIIYENTCIICCNGMYIFLIFNELWVFLNTRLKKKMTAVDGLFWGMCQMGFRKQIEHLAEDGEHLSKIMLIYLQKLIDWWSFTLKDEINTEDGTWRKHIMQVFELQKCFFEFFWRVNPESCRHM